jgi:hypothetical protein
MRNVYVLIISLLLLIGCSFSSDPIKSAFKKDEFLKKIEKDKDKYELQIAFTEISRNKDGEPIFKDFEFQVDENKYFYPASTTKLPIVVLTLDKINKLRSSGINITLKSKILISSNHSEKNEIQTDTITSFQNLIADVFLVSDNYSSNILIDFIGYNYFNTKMSQAGFKNTYLNHKFNPDPYVNIDWLIKTVDKQLISSNQDQIIVTANQNISGLKKGENKFQDGRIVSGSLDFSQKNRHSIRDMHNLLKRIIFPSKLDKENVFNLNVEDFDFL